MKIYCPHCGVKGSADDSYSGRKIKCPKCQEMFDLKPDMAIDQNEFLTADLGTEILGESLEQDRVQDDAAAEVVSLVEDAFPELSDEPSETSLGFDDDFLNEEDAPAVSEEGDAEEQVSEEDDALDWGDFGAELDKEIADSEQEDTDTPVESDDLFEDDGPVVDLDDPIADIAEEEPEVEDTLADDLGSVLGSLDKEELDGDADEVSLDLDEPLDTIEEVADTIEAADELEIAQVLEEVEDVQEENNLATLTAPEAVMPLFADDDDQKDEQSESTESIETAEVMAFADADLPEDAEEDEPDVIIGEDEIDNTVVVEDEPYGIDKEQCWQCGKKDSVGEPFVAIDGRLYCTECSPAEEDEDIASAAPLVSPVTGKMDAEESIPEDGGGSDTETAYLRPRFTVGGVIKEAWEKVKGVKGTVWAGSAIMYLIVIVIVAGGTMLLPSTDIEAETLTSYIPSALFQFLTQALYMIFMGGLLFMGIRRVAGDKVSWKMIFHGFSFSGKIIVVTILQSILITLGFILLILPGIYLTIGYAMAIPLIVDKNLSPWQALETSRKAIHKVWWRVAGIALVICLLFLVASIPLGIGLIWVWPLALVVSGVVYHRLFSK